VRSMCRSVTAARIRLNDNAQHTRSWAPRYSNACYVPSETPGGSVSDMYAEVFLLGKLWFSETVYVPINIK
jgi:hypothetical protein